MSLGTLTREKIAESKQCQGLANYSPVSKVGVSAPLVLGRESRLGPCAVLQVM